MSGTKSTKEQTDPKSTQRRSRGGWRRFRLWEKKRGTRQTGSTRWGAAGETLFYAVLFIVGIVLLTELVSLRVIWKEDNFLTSDLGLVLSILLLGSLIVTGAIGAIYSVVMTETSAERRAAIAKRATNNELLAEVQTSKIGLLPTIPDDSNWRNSPGIELAYRLPASTSPSWRLVVTASFCLLWNGAVAVLAVLALNRGDAFNFNSLFSAEWWTVFRLVVVAYAVIGLLILRHLFRMLMTTAMVGPTAVEVSALPLYPSDQNRVLLSQSGHLHIDWLELMLVCDEEVSFSDGTDTRSEIKRVYEESLFRHEEFEILPSRQFQCDCPLQIPAEAMHSFVSTNNAVTWKLMVRLQPRFGVGSSPSVANTSRKSKPKSAWSKYLRLIKAKMRHSKSKAKTWPPIERSFPLVVHPKV